MSNFHPLEVVSRYRDPQLQVGENLITVDLVIFACLGFREFVILELFTKSRIRELSISMIGSAIIIRISRDS